MLVLKHYWRSSCSWRVRWALAIKGISYQSMHIDLLRGEHKREDYLRGNPMGFVPVLVVDGKPYFESLAIIEWLDEVYSQRPLLPTDPVTRMVARQLAYMVSSGIQPLQNLTVQRYYSHDPQERLRYARHYIERGFNAYEQRLRELGPGTFSLGGEITLADICLIPQVYNALRFGCNLDSWPLIARVYQACLQTAACQKSSPQTVAEESGLSVPK